jgi:hypothetical protein
MGLENVQAETGGGQRKERAGRTGSNKESDGTTHSRCRTDTALTIFVGRAHGQPDGPGEGGSVGGAGGDSGEVAGETGRSLGHGDATEQGEDGTAAWQRRRSRRHGCLAVGKGSAILVEERKVGGGGCGVRRGAAICGSHSGG